MVSTGNLNYDPQEDLGPFMVKIGSPVKTNSPMKKIHQELKSPGGMGGGLAKKRMAEFFGKNQGAFGGPEG